MSTAPPPEPTPAAHAAPLCAACRVPLQRGFMLDLGYNDQARAAEWVEGAPQPSFWRGLQLDGRLGLPVQKAPGSTRTGPDVSAACFEVPSAYEITVAGKKLIGSAQSRRQGWVLQHGSLPLYGDIARVVDCLSLPAAPTRSALRTTLSAHATTLAELLTPPPAYADVVQVMVGAFGDTLNIDLAPGELGPAEEARVARLLASHYRNAAWTARV